METTINSLLENNESSTYIKGDEKSFQSPKFSVTARQGKYEVVKVGSEARIDFILGDSTYPVTGSNGQPVKFTNEVVALRHALSLTL